MKYKIQATYKVTETHEFSVDCGGFNFLIIYGKHINGWFIAIPNWNVCVEACEPTDYFYNAEKLAGSGQIDIPEAPDALAKAIKEHWESIKSLDKSQG